MTPGWMVQAAPELGGTWNVCQEAQLPSKKLMVVSMASSLQTFSSLSDGEYWHHGPPDSLPLRVAGFLTFLNPSAALGVLPAPNKAFLCGSASRFPSSHPLSAGRVPFPMSCAGRWRGLAALVCSQIRIFPFSLSSEV